MSDDTVAFLIHDCMVVAIKLGGPVLTAALLVGLLISFLQAITQINEVTLAFLPKLLVTALTLAWSGPFMVRTLTGFSHQLFDRIVVIGGL
jgi:flagellar biosynthesis protein FliQ